MSESFRVDAVELREVALPLVRPFRTSFGEEREKRAILVRMRGPDAEGWGECVAMDLPRYSEEWLDGAWAALEGFLVPSFLQGGEVTDPEEVGRRFAWVRGHRMARAAVEAAAVDAWLRIQGRGLAEYLGGSGGRVPCGVSVGISPSVNALLDEIHGYLEQGYRRVKLKIEPGRDVEVVRAVRRAFPDAPLTVDANGAYSAADTSLLRSLDQFDLLMVEQPLDHEDLWEHARLQGVLQTPICLDESIHSSRDAAAAIEMGACRVINIKPGRVGGLLEAKRVHDVARDKGVPVWIGGMLETGIGRAANLAMASLPGVGFPGDTSASDRYFRQDLTEMFELGADGTMTVPPGPGIGVAPDSERLEAFTRRMSTVQAG